MVVASNSQTTGPCIKVDKDSNELISVDEAVDQVDVIKKYCITQSTRLSAIASRVKHQILTPDHPQFNTTAFTDGVTVSYAQGFFLEKLKAQALILIHELLHVGLRHPQRMRKMWEAKHLKWGGDNFQPFLWNIAADCIVNLGPTKLVEAKKLAWPSGGCVTFENTLEWHELKQHPPHTWTLEQLYVHLWNKVDDNLQAKYDYGLQELLEKMRNAKDAASRGELNPGSIMLDIDANDPGDIPQDSEEEAKNWQSTMERAEVGDSPGGVIRNILGDMKRVETPWHVHLRRYMMARVLPTTEPHDTRPGRSMISTYAFNRRSDRNIKVPFEPGIQMQKGIKTMAVLIDTSGSIGDDILKMFMTQIQAIRNVTGANVVLVFADAAVQKVVKVKRWDDLVSVVKKIKGELGGGGTDFRPAVAYVNKELSECHVAVYLTDMYGPFPDTSRVPLIWASTTTGHAKPPVGTVIPIRDV